MQRALLPPKVSRHCHDMPSLHHNKIPVSDFKPVCGVNSAPSQLWYIDRNPKSIMALHNLSKWMRACETHPVCVGSGFALLPDRCIRVGTKSLPRVRLYESSSNETGSYLALSYVWGGYSSYVLKQSSYHSFKRQMDEQTMPKTYQDAIFLARQLDVPYVWIDALCIIQDDPGDWEAQSAKMANVYGNAYLTICASRSSSALEGFLTQRLASHVLCGESGSSNNSQAAYLFRSPHPHLNQRYSTSEPITSRAWCVQERVLSPRKVHFCSRGTIWECRTTMLSEQGDEYVPSTKAFASFVEGGAVDRWAEILSEYTGCHLTIESDRLPALSGIASRFASATGDEFLSGHWLSQLPLSLLWHRGYSRLRLARSYRAPSWAWPSVEGRIMLYTLDQQLLLEILGYECKSAGPNPFGNVANAWLKVRGPLISIEASALEAASLEQRPHIFYHCEFKISLAGCTSEVDASIALDMPMNATIVHLLVVARDINAEANLTGKHCYNCVILTSNMSQSDTYSRVGMAIIKCGPELSCGFAQHDMVLV